jgi:transketolase
LVENNPVPQEFVATNDTFGESGTPSQLMEKYGIDSKAIIKSCLIVINRKKN